MTKREDLESKRYAQRTLSPVVARLSIGAANVHARRIGDHYVFSSSTLADLEELRRDVFVELSIAITMSTPQLLEMFESAYNDALQKNNQWWYVRRNWCIKLWRHQFGVERR